MSLRPVPEGFHTVTPHLVAKGAAAAIDFYVKAFGAQEVSRHEANGKLMHAAIRIGDSMVMLADELPEHGRVGPDKERPSPVTVHLFVEDVDALFAQATQAGAKVVMPLADMFWGDRYGIVRDPFGHSWSIATHIEDVSPADMEARAAAAFSGGRAKTAPDREASRLRSPRRERRQ
ncbi:MAG: VOC family protein [bacterium]|nr:VOC family protein [bacterium]